MDKSDVKSDIAANVHDVSNDSPETQDLAKKKFVTPEISVPVDVLEATTFFQVTDSGVTN